MKRVLLAQAAWVVLAAWLWAGDRPAAAGVIVHRHDPADPWAADGAAPVLLHPDDRARDGPPAERLPDPQPAAGPTPHDLFAAEPGWRGRAVRPADPPSPGGGLDFPDPGPAQRVPGPPAAALIVLGGLLLAAARWRRGGGDDDGGGTTLLPA
jgi:hypothetical protein